MPAKLTDRANGTVATGGTTLGTVPTNKRWVLVDLVFHNRGTAAAELTLFYGSLTSSLNAAVTQIDKYSIAAGDTYPVTIEQALPAATNIYATASVADSLNYFLTALEVDA